MDGIVIGTMSQIVDKARLRNSFYSDKIFSASIHVYYGEGRRDYNEIEFRAATHEEAVKGAIDKARKASVTFWDNAKAISDKYRGN